MENIYNIDEEETNITKTRVLSKTKLHCLLKTVIKYYASNIDYMHLHNIIDHCIVISDNNIDLTSFYEKSPEFGTNVSENIKAYYLYNYIMENNCVAKYLQSIKINSKNNDLLEMYYRLSKNNYFLLYTAINNFDEIKKIFHNIQLKEHKSDNDEHDDNESDNDEHDDDDNESDNDEHDNDDNESDNDDNESDNDHKYIDVLLITNEKIIPKLTKNEDNIANKGNWGEIGFYNLDYESHIYIKSKLKVELSNIIIKKIYKPSNSGETEWDNRGDGCEGQYTREINILKQLYKIPHFPILLSTDDEKLEIYMSYCGEKITEINVPVNWKEQIEEIVLTLNEKHILHNDMHIGNFLVNDDIIHLVDFGWSSGNYFWPYNNIKLEDINDHKYFFDLLDITCKYGINDRINYVNSLKL